MSNLQLHHRTTALGKPNAGPLARALERVAVWHAQRKATCMARRTLSKLSSRHLQDIGLIENDIEDVLGSHRSGADSSDLVARARLRAGNW